MEPQLLIPGMQHGEGADFRAEVSGIASDSENCFRNIAQQQIADDFLILQAGTGEARAYRIAPWRCFRSMTGPSEPGRR